MSTSCIASVKEWIPLIGEPAVDSKNYDMDYIIYLKRIGTVALASLVFVAIAFPLHIVVTPLFTFGFFISAAGIITLIEQWRSGRKTDQIAVEHFCQGGEKADIAGIHISYSEHAAKLLADKKNPDLINQMGPHFSFDSPYTRDSFKVLVEAGMDIHHTDANGESAFTSCLKPRCIRHLMYLAEKHLLNPSSITNDQQFEIWKKVITPSAAGLLIKNGFDPKVRNTAGESALDWIKKNRDFLISLTDELKNLELN